MKTEPTEAYGMIEEDWYAVPYMGTDYPQDPDIVVDKKDVYEIAKKAFQEGQSSPKIKQLEWEEPIIDEDGSEWIESNYIFGQFYEIEDCHNGSFILYKVYCSETTHSSLDEAKAAAQEHFEKRIKECLL